MSVQVRSVVFVLVALFWGTLLSLKMLLSLMFQRATKKRETIPDVLRNPTLGLHEYVQLKDVKLHYVHRGSRDKPLMLFVHGFPEFWYSWRHQMEEFSQSYWTVAVDMRGYGESERKSNKDWYKIDALVDDIRQLVEALGKERCILVAHDWGGAVAHRFIRKHPDMLHSYILMNTIYFNVFLDAVFSNWMQFLKSWYIFFFQLPYLPESTLLDNDIEVMEKIFPKALKQDVEAYKYAFRDYDHMQGPMHYYRANMNPWSSSDPLTADRLNSAAVPGLYIHGMKDVAITPAIALVESWKGVQNITTATVDTADHFIQTSEPDAVNKIMADFLVK